MWKLLTERIKNGKAEKKILEAQLFFLSVTGASRASDGGAASVAAVVAYGDPHGQATRRNGRSACQQRIGCD